MEASSPLAAMHPPAAPTFGYKDMYGSHSHAHFSSNTDSKGSGTLFRDRLMPKARSDYFSVKTVPSPAPVHGSSPSASLAADMSQNWRIDDNASPQLPTPRRALFTTNVIMGALEGRGYQTTPPLPASSPGGMDMDISPLPQKSAYVAHQIAIQSPTPNEEDDEMTLDSPAPIVRQSSLDGLKPPMADRRGKLGSRRPSLSRAKGYSTGAIQNRLHHDGQVNLFKFGGDGRPGSSSSSISLSECFQDSPPQERRPQLATSPGANAHTARSKAHLAGLSGPNTVRNGSPISSHLRRPSNPPRPTRRGYRRSLSMFESTGDVIKPKEDPTVHALESVMDVEEQSEPVLPHFYPEDQNDGIPRITRSTFLEVLDGKHVGRYDTKLIIDSRFEYEYEGGHVDGAINCNDKDLLASHLFDTPMEGRTLIIFHCEYSAHRAPLMARHIRAEDRAVNAEFYPRLTYPEVYILDGGYSGFFQDHRERCYPCSYVEMDAAEHINTCEREMGRLRQTRKGFGRAQTFAFGQQDRSVHDSPTGRRRSGGDNSSPMKMDDSPCTGGDRVPKRMASY